MHSGENLAVAAITTVTEIELIRARMRATISMLDRLIAGERHLQAVPESRATITQLSAGRPVLLLQDLGDETQGVGE